MRFIFCKLAKSAYLHLAEYVSRFADLTHIIIDDGFNAERYTLVVALEKRVAEFREQLYKSLTQLKRVAPKEYAGYIRQGEAILEQTESLQTTYNQQVIEPDDISLSLSNAKQRSSQLLEDIASFKQSNKQTHH